jgi:hypothetical protein
MAGISGQGTTFNLPNYHGVIYQITPADTPFSSAIGVMSGGGEPTLAKEFEWQVFDLAAPAIPAHLEGQNAPTAKQRVRAAVSNICQIFHEAVDVSYSKLAAVAQRDGINVASVDGSVGNELSWQIEQALKQLKRDIEHTFINGVYAKPADNSAARKTRGLLEAISTNSNDAKGAGQAATGAAATDLITLNGHGFSDGQEIRFSSVTGGAPLAANTKYYVRDATTNTFKLASTRGGSAIDITADLTASTLHKYQVVTEAMVLDLMQKVWEAGGIMEEEGRTLMCGSAVKRELTKAFITDKGYDEESRHVAGVRLTQIETDFGRVGIMLNRYMPANELAVVSLEVCKPRMLLIPEKGFLFAEPLAKIGASDRVQIYGEIGLEYGAEHQHGKLTNISTLNYGVQ